jgi:hypothetical protein
VIVADTGAVVALIDRSDRHHKVLREVYETDPDRWVLPWVILAEVDYLVGAHVGVRAQEAFHVDLAQGGFHIAWGDEEDLIAAQRIIRRHRSLRLGLVDGVVMAVSGRLAAEAIATLDLRHFSAVDLAGSPRLLPRDL